MNIDVPIGPRHIVRVFGALSQDPQAIKTLREAPVGTIFDCVTSAARSSISLTLLLSGSEVAWFRKEEPGAELSKDTILLAYGGKLAARVETQNPLTVGLYRKGLIKESETPLAGSISPNKNQSTSSTQKDNNMNNFFSRLIAVNTAAAGDAAYLETGRIANNTVAKILIARLPFMARFYAKTPMGKLAIANAGIVLAKQLRPNDSRLEKLSLAMTTVAYQELIQLIDIEGMIDQLMAEPAIKRALDKVDAKADMSNGANA